MASRIISIVIVVIVIIVLGYFAFLSNELPPEVAALQEACLDSGGQVVESLCCQAAEHFPNLCLIGACGCSPENSHQIKTCDCGPDKCFDGAACVSSIEADEVGDLLEALKASTSTDFSDMGEVEIEWITEVEPEVKAETIMGQGLEATAINTFEYDNIETFLLSSGFEKDPYNFADGTVSGLVGYKKNQIVCTVAGGFTGYKEAEEPWLPPVTNKKDVEIKCGELSQAIVLDETCAKKETDYEMSLTEAIEIAESSDCAEQLREVYDCNEDTGTWWIDLDVSKEGCRPACVIDVETEETSINWRCTGAE